MRPHWKTKDGGLLKYCLAGLVIGITWTAFPLWSQAPTQTDSILSIEQRWNKDLGPAARNLIAANRDGVLRLSGSVDNLLTRDQAVRIASSTPGVVQISDQIKVKPEVRPDAAIQEDVQQALRATPTLRDFKPQVTVSQGQVTLSGTAGSSGEKQLAQQVVKGVRGVGEIQNNLISQPFVKPTDFELETDIRRLLKADRTLAFDNFDVQVQNGQATLSGAVKTLADKQRASQIASSTGIKSLDNTPLQVQSSPPASVGGHGPEYMEEHGFGPPSPTDIEQERQISATIRNDPQLSCAKIFVRVRHSRASLSGQVKNVDQQAALFSDAFISGVSSVDMSGVSLEGKPLENFPREMAGSTPELLTPVDVAGPWNDEAIRQAVNTAIFHDPRLKPYLILAGADHGKVTLTGGVDNLMAKRLAGETAGQIKGVQAIYNQLLIHPNGKPADHEVADNARAALQRDPVLARGQFQVAVQEGQAVLSGTADSDFQKNHAADVMSGLNGVVSVKDDITVNPRS